VSVLVLGAATTGRVGRASAERAAGLIAAGDEPEPHRDSERGNAALAR
jgi:hypothetical protein